MEDSVQNETTSISENLNSHLNNLKAEIKQYKKLDLDTHRVQDRLSLITRVASIGVWEWNIGKDQIEWDNIMYEIYGIEPRPFMTHDSWSKCIHPEDLKAFENLIENTLAVEYQDYAEFRVVRPDGYIRHISTTAGLIHDSDNKVNRVLGVNKDITERKLAEEALKKSENQLKLSNATKDKLFSILAHDLVSPFSSILGFSKLLMDSSKENDIEKVEEYANSVNSAANQTFHLLTNLLEWSRSQREKISFLPENIKLKQIIDRVTLLYTYAMDQKEIYLETNVDTDFEIVADLNMLYTIIRNLVSNAVKFTDEEGIIKISVISYEKETEICICDTGKGIGKDNLEQVLNPEINFSSNGSNSEKGTGLGLLICNDFVERHGGKFWIKSEENIGTEVHFTIPASVKVDG